MSENSKITEGGLWLDDEIHSTEETRPIEGVLAAFFWKEKETRGKNRTKREEKDKTNPVKTPSQNTRLPRTSLPLIHRRLAAMRGNCIICAAMR